MSACLSDRDRQQPGAHALVKAAAAAAAAPAAAVAVDRVRDGWSRLVPLCEGKKPSSAPPPNLQEGRIGPPHTP